MKAHPDHPTLSAVVCTRNRPVQLERALRSLHEQGDAPEQILVVDNAPAGDAALKVTRQLAQEPQCGPDVQAAEAPEGGPGGRIEGAPAKEASAGASQARLSRVEYFVEPVPGLDFARNRALRLARGEIVAFLDDDAVAHRDWVLETRRAFAANPELEVCMGRVDPLPPLTPGARLFESNGGFARGCEAIHLPRDSGRKPLIAWSIGIGSGCSMAVRKDAALRRGGFDEALDTAEGLPGGDLDLIWRTLAAGGETLYQPRVRALHEHRSDPDAVIEQIAKHNRGLVAMLVKAWRGASGRHRIPILAFLVWRLLKPGYRMARRAVGRDPLPQRALLRIGWSCWKGLGSYRPSQAGRTAFSAGNRPIARQTPTVTDGARG